MEIEDMEQYLEEQYDMMDVCLLAGKIMLESGAETYRVEDTMMRIAKNYGIKESHSYVTPTGIMFSIETEEPTKTKLIRISDRTTDLKKVMLVNSTSRRIANGELDVPQAYRILKRIYKDDETYSLKTRIAAAAISSGCFLMMFQGSWADFIPAVIIGGLGFASVVYVHDLVLIKFFSEFMAALVIGLLAAGAVMTGLGQELDKIIIGSVMPLVPGLLITNAVRDLIAGHFISGLSKGAEAFLTAFAIGSGIAVVVTLL
ncbi:membrane protein [Jeotgalibacillus alimentarius]|uniref:Membrane protein n=2 Tax=Jeotgalibacillus alimentarius TaxID=135826 RepID=A0A0C2V340_9BACL|nr:threonine/serine exporter family protein [Jeotgalibacillus alimentarius]KIL43467.1 membrane protein [Jeotgalibacillus alimentarius]